MADVQLRAKDIERYLTQPEAFNSVILCYGPDQGLVEERVQRIMKTALKGNDDPFCKVILSSNDLANDPGRLADEAGVIGLFGGKKVIRVQLDGSRPVTKPISLALQQGYENTMIIIEGGDLKPSNGVRSLIEKSKTGMAIACYKDDVAALKALIREELTAAKLTIEPEAQTLLLSLLGENRKTSRMEVQKLCLYAWQKESITVLDVENVIGDVSASLIDDTIDHVLSGNLKYGLSNFQRSLSLGLDGFRTIRALQLHLMRLCLLHDEVAAGQSLQTVISNARPKIHFKRHKHIARQLTLCDQYYLAKALRHIQSVVASSRGNPALASCLLRTALLNLGHRAKKRTQSG